jgi:hypothetical protein
VFGRRPDDAIGSIGGRDRRRARRAVRFYASSHTLIIATS